MTKNGILGLSAMLVVIITGCSTAPYDKRASTSQKMGDAAVRYGTVGALGAGGYAAGDLLGNSPVAGAAGAVAGVGAGLLATGAMERRTRRAYEAGVLDGEEAARAEIANDIWKRQAIYGGPGPTGAEALEEGMTGVDRAEKRPGRYRRVYVPSRTINGVVYPGGYQTVLVN